MSDVKFTVSNGQWTISYEGTEEFLEERLISTVQTFLDSGLFINESLTTTNTLRIENTSADLSSQSSQMTINNLCAKLNCQTGPDLVVASCVYMTYIMGQDTLPRREIAQTMKSATRYYKDSYVSNLSSYLSTLVKQSKLMERTQEVYILTPAFAREMEAHLA